MCTKSNLPKSMHSRYLNTQPPTHPMLARKLHSTTYTHTRAAPFIIFADIKKLPMYAWLFPYSFDKSNIDMTIQMTWI